MRVLVIIPAYNEAENILNAIADIHGCNVSVDYIVINDCSKDNTRQILFQNHANFIDLPINLGIGGGVQTGYRYAVDNDYDIAIQFDGDGQHDAKYLETLIAPLEAGVADVTIGSRFIEKEGFQSSSMRRLGINFLSVLIYRLCGIRIRDVTSGMRAVNRKVLTHFAQSYAQDFPEPEAILSAGLLGARIQEVPVQMRERQGGVSSINPAKSVYYMIKVSLALVFSRIASKKGATL